LIDSTRLVRRPIASKGGAPDDPQWFRNLVAHPDVTVEVPNVDEYANATTREIPVVVLEPR
jgi:hypothetical protein